MPLRQRNETNKKRDSAKSIPLKRQKSAEGGDEEMRDDFEGSRRREGDMEIQIGLCHMGENFSFFLAKNQINFCHCQLSCN